MKPVILAPGLAAEKLKVWHPPPHPLLLEGLGSRLQHDGLGMLQAGRCCDTARSLGCVLSLVGFMGLAAEKLKVCHPSLSEKPNVCHPPLDRAATRVWLAVDGQNNELVGVNVNPSPEP